MQGMDFDLHAQGFPQKPHEEFKGDGVHGIGVPAHVHKGFIDIQKGEGSSFPDQGIHILDQAVRIVRRNASSGKTHEECCTQVGRIGIGMRWSQTFLPFMQRIGFFFFGGWIG